MVVNQVLPIKHTSLPFSKGVENDERRRSSGRRISLSARYPFRPSRKVSPTLLLNFIGSAILVTSRQVLNPLSMAGNAAAGTSAVSLAGDCPLPQ